MVHTELSDTMGTTEEISCTFIPSRKVRIFLPLTRKILLRLHVMSLPRTAKNTQGKWVLRLCMEEPYINCSWHELFFGIEA